MNRIEELMNKNGAELIAICDSYGVKVGTNKERTQLKVSKKIVSEKIVAVELARAAEAAKKEKEKKGRKLYEANGKAQTMAEWSKELGIPIYVFCDRLNRYKWTVEKTFTTPLGKKGAAKKENNEQENESR